MTKNMQKSIKSPGEISKQVLFFGGVIILAIVLVVLLVSLLSKPDSLPEEEEDIEPVYEIVVGDIKFKLGEVRNKGNVLMVSESNEPDSGREDLTTTERFIKLTIAVENVGKDNIEGRDWDIQELIDSEGRKFYSLPEADFWIPESSRCRTLLKPGFTPTLCTKIYEVAKISTDLKVRVYSKKYKEADYFVDLGL